MCKYIVLNNIEIILRLKNIKEYMYYIKKKELFVSI